MDWLTLISRHVVARVYSIKENRKLFSYLRELERTQWDSTEELSKRQMAKLRNLLIHADENVDFYKRRFSDAGFDPYTFKSIDDLRSLPLLTKHEITENMECMISKTFSKDQLVKSCTGGSTGTQLHFFINKEGVDLRNACAWRHNRWANWELGVRVAAIWGNPKPATTLKAKIRKTFLDRIIYLDTMNMTDESMNDFASHVNHLREYVLYGHSHSIFLFADFLLKHRIQANSPVGIISTSMMLMKNERTLIEKVFQREVTDRYGCEELGLIGSECELRNGMHLNLDHLVVEFIKADGTDALPGEEGRIVVTDLTNYGMPFIRYEVGDVGVPSDRICGCGRGLPMMERVIGRTADFLVRQDGSLVAGVSLIERLLTNIPGIYQMQIVQNKRDSLLLRIVKGNNFLDEVTIESLRKEFEEVFPKASMQIEFSDSIAQEASGKYRFAICNIR